MLCNQCEQTAGGTACTRIGVCGKTAETAGLQDRLILALRRLSQAVLKAGGTAAADPERADFTARALFATLTNVNFDPPALRALVEEAERRQRLLPPLGEDAVWGAERGGIDAFSSDPDVASAMQILLYGLKGMAAYLDHAAILGQRDAGISAFLYEALAAGGPGCEPALPYWLDLILRCGKANLRALELLDAGNTRSFGDPTPVAVPLGRLKGKAILVSGHDLADLAALLEQTRDMGINVYTHGEMLPAHGYPELRKFPHLAGHYGTAWQNQRNELPAFPGAILFTTNCIQDPRGYADRVFTTGNVGWPGLVHCLNRETRDFSAVISRALELPGFELDEPGAEVVTGFGRKTLLDAAPAVLEAVRTGAVRHIFLVGGCDGARPGRNYYTELVEQTPPDTLVLTLGCGKFRFFTEQLGRINGLPRLMDAGQCNDAFAAVSLALALAKELGCDVNDLPLSLVLSWYEQKAVSILLTLLALGVKNIRIGPSLPAFVTPNILKALTTEWNLMPVTTPEADLAAMLGTRAVLL